MPMEIRIYIEGGGDDKNGRAKIRKGFNTFLASLRNEARKKRIRWNLVACGSRNNAFDDFKTALRTHPKAFNVLLVDAEGAVHGTRWSHLQNRDRWHSTGLSDDHCHLMVQAMEAWLIADIDALAAYYGQNFNRKAIPNTPVEMIPQSSLEPFLIKATRQTQKGKYHKIRHSCELLEKIDPQIVCTKADHCRKLFDVIKKQIAETVGIADKG